MCALLLPPAARAQVGPAATLNVLAPPVERVTGDASQPGVNGMNLVEGDRIRTGPGGVALITFLDGSSVTVLADAEVTVKQAATERGQRGIRLLTSAARVSAMAERPRPPHV